MNETETYTDSLNEQTEQIDKIIFVHLYMHTCLLYTYIPYIRFFKITIYCTRISCSY